MAWTEGDALAGYTFSIDIDGTQIAHFKEVSGLSMERQVVEHKANFTGGKASLRKTMGQAKYGDITLKKGKTDSKALWDWYKHTHDGNIAQARKNGSIVLYDYANGEICRWNFKNAWISKISIGSLQAQNNDVLSEEVTIVHEGIELG
jgi:phage tail-like protein